MSLAQRKLVFNFVLIAMSLITLFSLLSVFQLGTIHISTSEQSESTISLQQGLVLSKWQSRRLLQGSKDRPAPRGYPPPDGNALIHNPQKAPPGKSSTAFSNDNKKPAAWIPDNPPPLKVPPPHP